ncbi:MAG: oligopeptide/dipeptide ABC transporter ATP-binding protein [Alphaproteobacteria bacterium]
MKAIKSKTPAPLLAVTGVVRDYPLPRAALFARPRVSRVLHGVSLTIEAGRNVGLIGESGSGKTTLARIVVGLDRPDFGTVAINGENIYAATGARLRDLRAQVSMVFQDPYGSLDPRYTVSEIVTEPLLGLARGLTGAQRRDRVSDTLEAVGLAGAQTRYPHEFSGGQRQRIAIARALVTQPKLIVADEPTSALDVSVQAQVLNLLLDLATQRDLTCLFVSHDLTVVRHITHEVAVIFSGAIVESGPTQQVFAAPAHPYTATLIAAVPRADPALRAQPKPIEPEQPAPPTSARACPYATRCRLARARCRAEAPGLEIISAQRKVACFYPILEKS